MRCYGKEVNSHNELGHIPWILWPRKEKHDRGWQNGPGINQETRSACRWRFLRWMHRSMTLTWQHTQQRNNKKKTTSIPAYFWKSGFDAWKSILTLSKGATTVFACLVVSADALENVTQTHHTTSDSTRQTWPDDVVPWLFIIWHRHSIRAHS